MRNAIIPGSVIDPEHFNPWGMFTQLGPYLAEDARRARGEAQHYNDFRVGSIALAYSSTEGHVGFFKAANQNLLAGTNPTKMCAERIVMQKLVRAGFDQLVAMFISGPPQPDTQSGRQVPTLHSCGECREVLSARSEVQADSIFVSVHPEEDQYEIYMYRELEAGHDPHIQAPLDRHYHDSNFETWDIGRATYDLYNGGLLKPLELPISSPAYLARMAVTGELTSLYDEAD